MNHVEIIARKAVSIAIDECGGEPSPGAELAFASDVGQTAIVVFGKLLKEAGLVQEWQPIETAPTDCVVYAYGNIPGSYGYTEDRFDAVKARKTKEGRWVFAQPMSRYDPVYWSPTHWMPLPAPPEAAESE